jgi:subtilisin family serine protease
MLLSTATAVTFVTTPAQAGPAGAVGGPKALTDSYIIVLNNSVTASNVEPTAQELASRYSGNVVRTWHDAVRGFHAHMPATQARRLAADPAVKYVEQDQPVSLAGVQTPAPSWGLDRIDQRNLPLNNSYSYPNTGSGVTAYIIDTGIRTTHNDFGGRASWGTNTTGDGINTDCTVMGHGTHVASTAGGTTYGVAKGIRLIAVKVLDCSGSGTTAGVIDGINFATGHHTTGAAVANMSLGGRFSQALNDAVANSINDGISYAVAAGNDNINACRISPASTPAAITVGATQITDARAYFSNFGTCLDIFAPGVSITAASNASDTATATLSGTSMASPHATGVAALIKSAHPSFTPQQVRDKMVYDATRDVVTNAGTDSPRLLLNNSRVTWGYFQWHFIRRSSVI